MMNNCYNSSFEDFKPIRNMFRKLNVFDSLFVLKQYIDAFDDYDTQVLYIEGVENSNSAIIMPNVIDFYIVNSILYSSLVRSKYSLSSYKFRKKLYDSISLLEQKEMNPLIERDSFQWLKSFYYNQQKKYTGNYISTINRYWAIYSDASLSARVELIIGIPYKVFIRNAAWLYSFFTGHRNSRLNRSNIINLDKKYATTDFKPENILKVLSIISKPLNEMRSLLEDYMSNRRSFFWLFSSPHILYPIIEFDGFYYCVSTQYLLSQITGGMYYIADIPSAILTNEYGFSFQDYVGKILKTTSINSSYTIMPELTYGKDSKRTSDWIMRNDTELVFIECKTKRIQIASLLQSSIEGDHNGQNDPLMSDLKIFANGIIQLYKVHKDFCDNSIRGLPFDNNKKVFPILVILEDVRYQLSLLDEQLYELIKTGLEEECINPHILVTNKYKIFSISEFETEVQLMMKVGFANYWNNITEKGDEIDAIYREHFKPIDFYSEDFHDNFIRSLEKQMQVSS